MAESSGNSFLQAAFMAVASCTLVHFGFVLTGFEDWIHTAVAGGSGAETIVADTHAGHDHAARAFGPKLG